MSANERPPAADCQALPERELSFLTFPCSVPVTLTDLEGLPGSRTVLYCDVCGCWGSERTVHLCGLNWAPSLRLLLAELVAAERTAR